MRNEHHVLQCNSFFRTSTITAAVFSLDGITSSYVQFTPPTPTRQDLSRRVCVRHVNWIRNNLRLLSTEKFEIEHVRNICGRSCRVASASVVWIEIQTVADSFELFSSQSYCWNTWLNFQIKITTAAILKNRKIAILQGFELPLIVINPTPWPLDFRATNCRTSVTCSF